MNLRIALLCFLPWMLTSSSWAQVTVSVIMDQEQFLPGEAVAIKVRVVNHSGQTLELGRDNSWLGVAVEAENSFVVRRTGEVPVIGSFDLPPSKMATKELDIAPYFTLSEPGRYSVVATVQIKEWNQTLISKPSFFDIISGRKLWEQAFGVPNAVHPDEPPEVRKYLLQQVNHLRTQIALYARITDANEERTLTVVPIGPIVSFSAPKALLDKDSNLHVLYQSGPHTSTYFEMNPDGKVLARERFEYSNTRPRLYPAEDGTISVKGGVLVPTNPKESSVPETTSQENDEG